MSFFRNVLQNLPEVTGPTQKRLSFKEKLKWTLIILVLFYVLGMIPLFGLGANSLQQFEYLSIILGAKFGSLISLGIGPIVTASIVLQLLNGSGMLKFDLTTHEGKKTFQGVQKVLAYFFIIFEGCIYVFMGGLSTGSYYMPSSNQFLETAVTGAIALAPGTITALKFLLVGQLALGGLLIMFMDEIVSKWGFGSGISLFIAAGVSQEIFIRAFSWFTSAQAGAGSEYSSGEVIKFFQALFSANPDLKVAGIALVVILSTVLIFALAVYLQAMKIEIPLSFGRIRGHGIRWPLNFVYTSNIPVILVAALFANMQLWAKLLEKWGHPFLGIVDSSGAKTGLIAWINPPGGMDGLAGMIIKQGSFSAIGATPYLQAMTYMLAMVIGCVIFSYFWVQTAGMDARSQAKQIMASGLQIPGFRKDQRVLERLLDRYIGPLTIMGAIAIGILAALADLLGALSRGTGILLAVMIIYRLYEEIAQKHMMDMHPALRKMME